MEGNSALLHKLTPLAHIIGLKKSVRPSPEIARLMVGTPSNIGWNGRAFLGNGSVVDKGGKGILNKVVKLLRLHVNRLAIDHDHLLLLLDSLQETVIMEFFDQLFELGASRIVDGVQLPGNLINEAAGDVAAPRLVHGL